MSIKDKRIMFAIGALTRGGAEKVISILASECAELGAEVSLVLLNKEKRIYQVSDKVKIYQAEADNKKFKELICVKQARAFVKEFDPDIIVPFLPLTTLCFYLVNIGIGKKVVVSERADPYRKLRESKQGIKHKIVHILIRTLKMLTFGDHMVFQTLEAQAFYGKKALKNGTVIPNPLDTAALPKRLEGEREKKIIAAGRFSEEKNFPMLIRAFARFNKDFPNYTLELCGEGALRGDFETLCQKLNIKDAILMPGFVNDLTQRMVNAAMYVSTSNHEGISNSMLEALGMGVPTIVTDCPVGGARMFVKTDENGILIKMNDEDALVNAMTKIATDKEYADKISKNAIEIREQLSAKKITEKWSEVFDRVTR